MTRVLRVDVETFSSVDLKKCGAHKYVQSPDFEIMLFGYAFDDEPRRVVDLLSGESLPTTVLAALTDPMVIKRAFNASFEILTISEHFGLDLDIEQWECTMVHGMYCGLPGNLDDLTRVLNTRIQKDNRGKSLIRFFCVPCKPTKVNGGRTRNYPKHDPERWKLFIYYCGVDVDSEREAGKMLDRFPVPELEWQRWRRDLRMNSIGVRVDAVLVEQAIRADIIVKERLTRKACELSGIKNPGSVKQIKEWMAQETGEEVKALNKDTVPGYIKKFGDHAVGQLLQIRQELAKTSVSKYHAMQRAMCADGYVRGLTQFYGANRTGRAAGRLVQLQNLRKNAMARRCDSIRGPDGKGVKFDELALARDLLRQGDIELIDLLWGNTLDVLSQLTRTALLPDEGCVFAPVDFSAIEARWLAWASGCQWRLDVFNSHGKIYEASASEMFGIPIEQITKAHPARAKGKVAELALGYQGGEGALVRMGALEMGLQLHELDGLVKAWRAANPEIKNFWYAVDEAAIRCVRTRRPVDIDKGMGFRWDGGILWARLSSGRELAYVKPKIGPGMYGDVVQFWGMNQMTKQWEQQDSYGGRWVENFDQASCRDLLYYKLDKLEELGLHECVRFHVHDEAVPSVRIVGADKTLQVIQDVFAEPVPWAPGLPLRGDGSLIPYYQKDD